MASTESLLYAATWLLFGMSRIVFTSAMVERRIDKPDPVKAIAFTWAAAKQRGNPANYDARGRRLLPWYRAVTITYWSLVAGVVWSVLRST